MGGMKYGYARISADDQISAMQMAALRSVRCAYIFEDKGQSAARCPGLRRCLKMLRAGDTLIVWRLDRLGNSLSDLITILHDLRGRGVHFQSLSEAINSTTPKGRITWQIVAMLAECEYNRIGERAPGRAHKAPRRGGKPERKRKLASGRGAGAGKTMAAGRSPESTA